MTFADASSSNAEQLLAALRQIDIRVPARTEGRLTEHTECWTMARLLSSLAISGRIAYPLTIVHRDRPDFLLTCQDSEIGVEVTEAISRQYAAYCALAEREFPDVFLEPAHFRWGEPDLSTQQMRDLLKQSQLSSDGWAGNQPEQEWALFIRSIVDAKLKKLANPDFDKFNQNWLAVCDNLPLPNVHLGNAVAILRPLLHEYWASNSSFDTLFIEHGPVIARITAEESEHLHVNDLWD